MRITFLFIFLNTILLANHNYELKLYEKVLPLIFNTKTLLVYADSNSKQTLKESAVFKLVDNCSDATLLIGKNFGDLSTNCKSKPLFATSYRSYKNSKNSIGAFYWRKGRPQIKFNLENIQSYDLSLPNSLRKYTK